MTAPRALLKDLDSLRDTRDIGGFFAGVASGLVVSLSVLTFFLSFDLHLTRDNALLLAIPFTTALFCTTISTTLAIRAETTGKAIAWTFAGNVLPPTVLCLPTIIGLFFAAPAGLVAFAVVLPIVLIARSARSRDVLGADARERLVGAAALATVTVVLLALGHAEPQAYDPYAQAGLDAVVLSRLLPLVSAFAGVVLAAMTALPETRRAYFADRIRRGQMPGVQSAETAGITEVTEVATLAGGPMRGGEARQTLGMMVVAPTRAAVGVAMTVTAAALLLVAFAATLF